VVLGPTFSPPQFSSASVNFSGFGSSLPFLLLYWNGSSGLILFSFCSCPPRQARVSCLFSPSPRFLVGSHYPIQWESAHPFSLVHTFFPSRRFKNASPPPLRCLIIPDRCTPLFPPQRAAVFYVFPFPSLSSFFFFVTPPTPRSEKPWTDRIPRNGLPF